MKITSRAISRQADLSCIIGTPFPMIQNPPRECEERILYSARKEGIPLKKNNWWKIIFIVIVLIILCLLFGDSFSSIQKEISDTAGQTLLGICLCGVFYNLSEGLVYVWLARRHQNDFHYRDGIACSYYTAFYRTVTLGSGTAAATVYFYLRKGFRCRKGLPSVQSNMYCRGLRWLCLEGWAFSSAAPI